MTYWEKRQQELNTQLEKDEAGLKKRLSSFYNTESRKMEQQIAIYYQRYGEDNIIQYRKLMENLPDVDKRLLIEQMDQFAEKYPEYADLLPIRESIYKLNRLEGLQTSIKMQQLEIGAVNNRELHKHLEKQAMRCANAAAETMGFGKNFYSMNPDIVKNFVNVPWTTGGSFSERIWKNTDKLASYLNNDIAQGFARGDSYERLVRQVGERFDHVSRNDIYRMIYTEGTYVTAEASMQPFQEDFEEYQISTAGDSSVCDICKGIARKTFKIKERKPGVNFPPFHSWCRCTFIVVVANWNKWMDDYEKRHGNGQAGKVAKRLNTRNENDILNLESLIPAESVKKAVEQALTECKLNAYYKDFDLNVANMVNEEVYKAYQMFGDLSTVLYSVKEYPGEMTSYARYSAIYKEIYLKNVRSKDALIKMKKAAEYNYKAGYWSTNCAEHAVRHETGHAVVHLYTDNNSEKLDKIRAIREEIYDNCVDEKNGWSVEDKKGMRKAKRYLSYYALKSDEEFIAESIAEYMAGNPRETAKKVVEILLGK